MLPSIHALSPTEEGGSIARTGFLYQDHVAAGFCIQMLRDSTLTEVWCETEDDVTLIWNTKGGLIVEFVQVKANELRQLWTLSVLCSGGTTQSIIAKSLAHDRCAEPCRFRIVTRGNLHPDLYLLSLDREHQQRCISNGSMRAIHAEVLSLVGDVLSPSGRSASNWLADTVWQVGESEQALTDNNRWSLQEHLEKVESETLFTDQITELYNSIVLYVQNASFPRWRDGPEKKKLKRESFREWLLAAVNRIRGSQTTKSGANLRRKMNDAMIPSPTIDTADDFRRSYRNRTLTPRYQQEDDLKTAELEVRAVMQHLLSELDAGNLTDDGRQFHARCLGQLNTVRQNFPAIEISFLQGALYFFTDRCRHRFLRSPP